MSSRSIACGVLTVLLLAGSASAHHNMSAYFDFNNRVTVTGTLAKIDWRNPHIELIVDGKDGEKAQPWRLEGPSPGFFRDRDVEQSGFRRRSRQGGDRRSQPRARRLCLGTSADDDAPERQARVGVSAKLLTNASQVEPVCKETAMKDHSRTAIITASTAVAVVFLLAPVLGQGQSAEEKAKARAAARARGIAQARENNTQILTLYDRQGNVVETVNERDFYNQPVISPDKTRIAVVKNNPETETRTPGSFDVATGQATRITTSQRRELTRAPVWSPDGKELAYVSLRAGTEALYRKAANGEGNEELLYKHSGFGMNLMGWSLDGRYLSYFTTDLSGGILHLLPLEGAGTANPSKPSAVRRRCRERGSLPTAGFSRTCPMNPAGPKCTSGRLILRAREPRAEDRGRYPPKVAWAWVSGGRTAKSSTTWPPIGDSWRSK